MNTKTFNATKEGQLAMCIKASSYGTAIAMNNAVKSKGGTGYPQDMIESANEILLRAIKDDLVNEWNSLVGTK